MFLQLVSSFKERKRIENEKNKVDTENIIDSNKIKVVISTVSLANVSSNILEELPLEKTLRLCENVKNVYLFYSNEASEKFKLIKEKLNNKNFENRKLGIKDKALDGKYLILEKVEFSEKLEKISFFDVENIEELMALKNENYGKDFVKLNEKSLEAGNSANKINGLNEELKNIGGIAKIKKIEKNGYFTVFFVEKKDKGEFIGKNGKNIRKLKKIFGDIVVKEM